MTPKNELTRRVLNAIANARNYDKTTQKISHFNFCSNCGSLERFKHENEEDCKFSLAEINGICPKCKRFTGTLHETTEDCDLCTVDEIMSE